MTLWRILPQWLRGHLSHSAAPQRMQSTAQLRNTLERERMRADRRQGQFTVVEFSNAGPDTRLGRAIITVLSERLRATDEFGPLGGGIGVVLPETSVEGARQLAEYVAHAIPATERVAWVIRPYPCEQHEVQQQTSPLSSEVVEPAFAPAAQLFIKPLPLWKRAIDVAAASAGLIICAPVLLLAAAAIKITSPGPVLFLQRRTGLGGQPFTIYKLRTMQVDAESYKQQLRDRSEQDGPAFKIKNDPRITAVGKYLRKTCLDELPQLWNVLKGDMTLVGPRPLPCDESAGCQNWELRRLDVTPGLTCIWQVRSGRSRIPFSEWMRMDLRYIRGRGMLQDLKLLVKTFLAVVLHRASH